jgi:hypothetical protein
MRASTFTQASGSSPSGWSEFHLALEFRPLRSFGISQAAVSAEFPTRGGVLNLTPLNRLAPRAAVLDGGAPTATNP